MAASTNPFGRPIVRTLRIEIPIDVYRRLQMLQLRTNVGKFPGHPAWRTLPDMLLHAATHGLDELEPALDLNKRCKAVYVPSEVLHDGSGVQELQHAYGTSCRLIANHYGPHLFEEDDPDPEPTVVSAEFDE